MCLYPKKGKNENDQQKNKGNNLVGTIPDELGTLTSLTQLNLGGNKLSGTIPSSLNTLTNLKYVQLNDNMLEGTIPQDLWNNMTELIVVNLHGSGNSKLKGTIPCIAAIFTVDCDSVMFDCLTNRRCMI